MRRSVAVAEPPRQRMSIQQQAPGTGCRTAVQRALDLLQQAISECGYTFDALCAHLKDTPWKNRSYVHQILNAERPCRLDFIAALPLDVRKRYAELVAAQYHTCVCDEQRVSEAARAITVWLLSMKPEMVRASLDDERQKSEVA